MVAIIVTAIQITSDFYDVNSIVSVARSSIDIPVCPFLLAWQTRSLQSVAETVSVSLLIA